MSTADQDINRRLWEAFSDPQLMRLAKAAVELYGRIKANGGDAAFRAAYGGSETSPPFISLRAFVVAAHGETNLLAAGTAVSWMLWRAGNARIPRHYEYIRFYREARGSALAYPLDERPEADVLLGDPKGNDTHSLIVEVVNLVQSRGMTLKTLAQDAGVNYATLHSWYVGRRTPRKSAAAEVVAKLRAVVDELESGTTTTA